MYGTEREGSIQLSEMRGTGREGSIQLSEMHGTGREGWRSEWIIEEWFYLEQLVRKVK